MSSAVHMSGMGGGRSLIDFGGGPNEGRGTNHIIGFLAIGLQQCLVHSVPLIVGYLGMLDYPVESFALL